jgi:hypothetical protein
LDLFSKNESLQIQLNEKDRLIQDKDEQLKKLNVTRMNAFNEYKQASDAHINQLMSEIAAKNRKIDVRRTHGLWFTETDRSANDFNYQIEGFRM